MTIEQIFLQRSEFVVLPESHVPDCPRLKFCSLHPRRSQPKHTHTRSPISISSFLALIPTFTPTPTPTPTPVPTPPASSPHRIPHPLKTTHQPLILPLLFSLATPHDCMLLQQPRKNSKVRRIPALAVLVAFKSAETARTCEARAGRGSGVGVGAMGTCE